MADNRDGLKRSHQQMTGQDTCSRYPYSTTTSRETSPPARLSRIGTPHTYNAVPAPLQNRERSPRRVSFEPDASIVLIGVKGVGKSSLGVLAATAYGRRLVESEREFQEATGHSAPEYRKLHGPTEYHRRHRQVLQYTLEQYTRDCVIVMNFSDLEYDGADLLRAYAQEHLVIHVLRDAKGVHSYLRVLTEDRVKHILRVSGPILRACSEYDFFNLSAEAFEAISEGGRLDEHASSEARPSSGTFLTLKRAENDFLTLLCNVAGDHARGPSHQSAYPLSHLPVERRQFTYAVVVDAARLLSGEVDLEEAQTGVDAVELLIDPTSPPFKMGDCSSESDLNLVAKAFGIVRRATIFPIIMTVAHNPGLENNPGTTRFEDLTHTCMRLAPDFCTVNLKSSDQELRALVAGKRRTKIIGTETFVERPANGWNDPQCMAAYDRARSLGCDIVKLTMPATADQDHHIAQALRQKLEASSNNPSLIAYNTGSAGRPSLCSNPILTPVRSAGSSKPDIAAWQGHLTVKELTTALFANFIHQPMSFYVYGATVDWSLSPAMHNAAYKACGQVHRITTCSTGTLDIFARLIKDDDFGGAALTQPHKTTALALMDALSQHAKAIGAVNTVIPLRELEPDGSFPDQLGIMAQRNRRGPVKALFGDNTDWIGIRACIRRGLSPANTIRSHSSGLVCGAGGMGRAAVYAMISMGVNNIFVCNRTVATARALADHYNKQLAKGTIKEQSGTTGARVHVIESFASPWPQEFRFPTMIVCTIPAEKTDGSSNVDFRVPSEWLKSPTGGVAVELSYKPLVTAFVRHMQEVASKGWILMDGFDHLPEQAFGQYELFTGRRAPRKLMRDVVYDHFRRESRPDGEQ